jgi:hypothetical protein
MRENIPGGNLYLIEIDNRLPEVVSLLVEVPHSNLSKVTRMVPVQVRPVMMLSTSKTSSTGMLPVLPYTTVSCGDMTATVVNTSVSTVSMGIVEPISPFNRHLIEILLSAKNILDLTYCLRVFVKWVGIVDVVCRICCRFELIFELSLRFLGACPKCALASLVQFANPHHVI